MTASLTHFQQQVGRGQLLGNTTWDLHLSCSLVMTCNANDDGDGVGVDKDIIIMIIMIIEHCWWGRSGVIWRDGDWQASVTSADLRRPPYTSYQSWSFVMIPPIVFLLLINKEMIWWSKHLKPILIHNQWLWIRIGLIIPPNVIHDSYSSTVKWFYGLYPVYQFWPMAMIHNQEVVKNHDDFRMIPKNDEPRRWWSIACIVGIILTLPLASTELTFLHNQILIMKWIFNFW